jgi:DNA-binding CsgD family transcriptional regulator
MNGHSELTDREKEIVWLMLTSPIERPITTLEIAERLGISYNTAKTHLRHIEYKALQKEIRKEARQIND